MHLYIHIITLSLTHLHFSAFISAVIHHYLMLLAFIWQELIIDSVIVKDCWQTDFITLSVILDTTWLLPSFPTSCILDKIKSTCLIKWTLIQVSLENFVTDFSFFLTTWVITPSLPWVTKMLLSLMKLVCQWPVRRLFVFCYVFYDMISFYLMRTNFLVNFFSWIRKS